MRNTNTLTLTMHNTATTQEFSNVEREAVARADVRDQSPLIPTFPLEAFGLEEPRLRDVVNALGMKGAAWLGVGLNKMLGSRANGRLGIITYHRVVPRFNTVPTHNVTPECFRAQLSGLLKRGYVVWPLPKLLRYRAEGKTIPPKTIAVTFDDGFQSVFTHAWPILRELRIPATVFLNTGYLDSTAPFPFDVWGLDHRDKLPPDAYRPMTFEQCHELAGSGLIDLGAHTHTHRDLRGRPELFRSDLQTSVDIVREAFSLKDVMFAFPFGSRRRGFADADLVAAAKQTGVVCGLTTECSLVDMRDDPFQWGRFNAFEWDSAATLAAKLEGWYTWAAQFKHAYLSRRSAAPIAAKPTTVAVANVSACRQPAAARALVPGLAPNRLAGAHIVSLVNSLAHHERPVYLELARRVGKLTILVSSQVGANGLDQSAWHPLDVRVQRTWSVRRPQRHPFGFDEKLDIHIPWKTISELGELKPDVVIAHETGFRSLLSSFYARRRTHVPLILTVGMSEHTEQGRGWARYWLRRWLFRHADAVGVNGGGTGRYVASLGVEPERMFHRPYVALPESQSDAPPTRDAQSAYHLLYVGRFIELKGLLPFVKSLASWAIAHPEREVAFSLVGSGPLEDAIRAEPVPPNVTLRILGRRQPAELAQVYAEAGILVLPTLCDEWGLVVNEALASGMPVLGSVYSQAVDELCGDGTTGWTFRPDVPCELEQAIEAALTMPLDQLDAMRSAARKRVAHLTPSYVVDGIAEVVERLLAKKQER